MGVGVLGASRGSENVGGVGSSRWWWYRGLEIVCV